MTTAETGQSSLEVWDYFLADEVYGFSHVGAYSVLVMQKNIISYSCNTKWDICCLSEGK